MCRQSKQREDGCNAIPTIEIAGARMEYYNRSLSIFADGEPLTDFGHVYLSGKEAVGLYPMPYTLRLWNLSEDQYLFLSRAKFLSVEHDGSVLAAGDVADVFRYLVEDGTVTTVCFSLGLQLWEAPVSLSLEAGVSVSETVRQILSASGTGISLLTYTGPDPLFLRGQAIFGRAAESLVCALSAARARGCLVPAGLCVLPGSDQPVSMVITEEDMLTEPEFPSGDLAVLRLKVAGWPIGKKVEVRWQGRTLTGIIAERLMEADNQSGPWYSEVLLERNMR